MINYTVSVDQEDLTGILELQKSNLAAVLTSEEILSQGFVTVNHSYADLKSLHDKERHLIAKEGNKVIAYLLAMTAQSMFDIPVLIPMFEVFNQIYFESRLISDYHYIVVGQVCVDKQYRGQGILDNCYAAYKRHFMKSYDFAITEIASTNLRSLNAHKRIGFEQIHHYTAADKTEWVIVLWDWKKTRISATGIY
jgi:hypothetical protein